MSPLPNMRLTLRVIFGQYASIWGIHKTYNAAHVNWTCGQTAAANEPRM